MDIKFKFRHTFYYLLVVLLIACQSEVMPNDSICEAVPLDLTTYNPILFPHDIEYLVIHCTATPEGRDLTRDDLDRIWESRDFERPGYHMVINLAGEVIFQGEIDDCLMEYEEMRWGVSNMNHKTLHLSYVGGVDLLGEAKDTRTSAQINTLIQMITFVKGICPDIKIRGHKDFSKKACPSFEVSNFLTTFDIH